MNRSRSVLVRPRSTLLLGGTLVLLLFLAPGTLPAEEGEEGYLGDASVCLECHQDVLEGWKDTKHSKVLNETNALSDTMALGCEACHGPGQAHVEAGGGKGVGNLRTFGTEGGQAVDELNATCLGCHQGGAQIHWEGSVHETRGLACTSCHSVHDPASEHAQLKKATQSDTCGECHMIQRSRQFRESRMPVREGHMECSSCHNPHGTATDNLIAHVTVNDNCLSCHADKRGPFMWEHAPVNENCLNCHVPHGSTKRHMLRVNVPRLCQQCHVASRHPSEPHLPNDRFVVGGSCLNCHSQIHGSNHPAGFVFSR